jgi:hypothetical protein
MMDKPKRQFPFLEDQNTLLYLGASMNPTLENLDVIQFYPYQDTPLQKGDVVVIQRYTDPGKIVIHRIVSVSPIGIRTQGDNCGTMDSWVLMPSEILGYVTSIRRKNQIIRIHRGRLGYQKFLHRRTIRAAFIVCRTIAQYLSQGLCHLGLPVRILSPFLTFRMVTFSGSNRSETQLFVGPLCIGRLQNGAKKWEIKPLYRFFINPSMLPFPEEEKTGIIEKSEE